MKRILESGSISIVLGTGGVGKTTVTAALGLAAASGHLNTALITVDPARRLRDALGLKRLGGAPTRISESALRAANLDPSLRLSAMQLDVKGAWDTFIERFVTDPRTRKSILNNPFYRNLTQEFAGSEAFASLQQLYNLHEARSFDIEIVDTPPASHAFEFLQAPARLIRLLDSRAARWLFTPSLSAGRIAMRLASQAARFVLSELERFAGGHVLSAIADFFAAASEATDSIVDRLHKTEALLHSPAVHFVMVTTAEQDRLRAARELAREMHRQNLRLDAIVINRFLDEETWRELLLEPSQEPAHMRAIAKLHDSNGKASDSDAGVRGVVDFLDEYRERAIDALARVQKFTHDLPEEITIAICPEIEIGISNLAALKKVSEFILTPTDVLVSTLRTRRHIAHAGAHHKSKNAG